MRLPALSMIGPWRLLVSLLLAVGMWHGQAAEIGDGPVAEESARLDRELGEMRRKLEQLQNDLEKGEARQKELAKRKAPEPAATNVVAKPDETWWSLQPLTHPVPPPGLAGWGRTPIDAFVGAKLKEKGLQPTPEADRRTLIRRLTFELHGLPPAPEEVEAFVNDQDPQAYERLVDRLLASPRYGERWGRHWLDVVHYGDTHGYDKDKRRPNAWPYRDYVIRAFNEDKPYGRFASEQVAGDVLYPEDPDGVVATGFISAGPWDYVGQVELREETTDKKITRALDRDDMVSNTIGTFNSMTVHCARCHHHKFDPIRMEDYYRLQAVFAGVDRANRSYHTNREIHRLRQTLEPEQKALEEEELAVNSAVAAVTTPKIKGLDAWMEYLRGSVAEVAAPSDALKSPSKGYHSQIARSRYETKWVQVDLGHVQPIDQVYLVPAHLAYEGHPGPGFGFPRRFKVEVADDPDFQKSRVIVDETKSDVPNPGDAPYASRKLQGMQGRYVRVTATRLWRRGGKKSEDWIFALAEMVVLSGERNVAQGAPVSALDSIDSGSTWAKRFLVDGCSSQIVLGEASPSDGYQSALVPPAETNAIKWVQADLGEPRKIAEIRLYPARSSAAPEELGYGFPVRFRIEASNDPRFETAEMVADRTKEDYANPGDRPAIFAGPAQPYRYVRVTATSLWRNKEGGVLALGEWMLLGGDRPVDGKAGARERSAGAVKESKSEKGKTSEPSWNLARRAQFSALDSTENGRWGLRYVQDGFSSLARVVEPERSEGFQSQPSPGADTNKWVQIDLGDVRSIDGVRLWPAWPQEPEAKPGFGFPARYRVEVSDEASFARGKVVVDRTQVDGVSPGDEAVTLKFARQRGRYVRLTATRLWRQKEGVYLLALAEMEVLSGARSLQARRPAVASSDSLEQGRWGLGSLVDGVRRRPPPVLDARLTSRLRDILLAQAKVEEERQHRRALVEPLLDSALKERRARQARRAAEVDNALAQLPKPQWVFAAAHAFDREGNFTPADEPRPVHLLRRGDVNRPETEMAPGALACVPGLESVFQLAHPKNEGERRAALARWITDPKHPLTWRSIVNRTWQHHFGRGLVETPNDFGRMGSLPTHPELLDWLASEFLAHGQSLKWLHRLMVTSAVYRQGSGVGEAPARWAEASAIDADNRFLWRANRERLDAESLRDAVLAVSGQLNLAMGGPGFDLFAFEDDHSPRYLYEKADLEAAANHRRSVYRFVVRSVPDPWMETLDCADASQSVPVRHMTITALQALALLNHPFVLAQAQALARRVEQTGSEPAHQVETAWRLALQRAPTPGEQERLVNYCRQFGLANTCRLIFNSNEFLFVD